MLILLGFAMKVSIHFTAKLAQNGCGLKTLGYSSKYFEAPELSQVSFLGSESHAWEAYLTPEFLQSLY